MMTTLSLRPSIRDSENSTLDIVFGGNLLEMGKPISNSGLGVEKGRRLSGGPRWRRNGKHRRIERIRGFVNGPIRRPLEREQYGDSNGDLGGESMVTKDKGGLRC